MFPWVAVQITDLCFLYLFSPLPLSSNIGPLTGLWFDTIFLKRPNVMSQADSAGE